MSGRMNGCAAAKYFVESHHQAVLDVLSSIPELKSNGSRYLFWLLDIKDHASREVLRELLRKRARAAFERKRSWMVVLPLELGREILRENKVRGFDEPLRAGEIMLFATSSGFKTLTFFNVHAAPPLVVQPDGRLMVVLPNWLAPLAADGTGPMPVFGMPPKGPC
jgi:hypothetical protein